MVLPNFFKSVRKQGNTFRLFGKKHKKIAVWIDPPKTAFCLLYAISPFSYHRSSVAQIEPLCQPPEHNRKVLAQPHKESCLSRCRAECEGNPKISRTLKSSGYSLESTVLLLSQNIAKAAPAKTVPNHPGIRYQAKKDSGRDFPCTAVLFLFPTPHAAVGARLFPSRRSSDPDAACSGTERIAPLHREALPTSALHIAAAQPAAKDPRSIHRLFCDPLKRSSPFKSAVNLRLPRCRRTRTFSGLVCTKPAISLSEY